MKLNNNSVSSVLSFAKGFLKENKIDNYALDAEVILMSLIHFTKTQLFTKDDFLLSDGVMTEYKNLLEKRVSGVPTQYITGTCEFMSMDFKVNENVLIPRPDTEILVETVIQHDKQQAFSMMMDMCTGSGCIAISLAKYCKKNVIAVDISPEAVKIAKANAEINGVVDTVNFIESNLFSNVAIALHGKIDAIVSNPPYIESADVKTLMKEVREHEPLLALDGGNDGLDFYREITKEATLFLKPGGMIFFEVGYNQANAVKNILQDANFYDINLKKDLSNLNRVVYAWR